MVEVIEFLFSGILLGLAQGLSPGPLIALIFSETLKYGKKEGIKIAVSPLITDSLIVLLTLAILASFAQYSLFIGVISLFGACYLIYLGVENLRVKTDRLEVNVEKKDALRRGIIANLLSPHPYLFWLSIGSPTILESTRIHISATVLFIAGFYVTLIGSKTAVALIVDKSKSILKSKYYVYVIRALGILLIVFALTLVTESLRLITTAGI
jgi:threonine/homoserine/homoserine lactone efflux protein